MPRRHLPPISRLTTEDTERNPGISRGFSSSPLSSVVSLDFHADAEAPRLRSCLGGARHGPRVQDRTGTPVRVVGGATGPVFGPRGGDGRVLIARDLDATAS